MEYDPLEVPERIFGRNIPSSSKVPGIRPRKDVGKRLGKVGVESATKQTKDVNKQTQGDATAEVLSPKRTREPEVRKSLTVENICTPVFM